MADVRVPKLQGGPGKGKKRQPMMRKNEKPENEPANVGKYHRGARIEVKGISDKKLRSHLQENEAAAARAAVAAARAEILLPEASGYMEADDAREKTYKVTQSQVKLGVDANTAAKALDLRMPDFAPYRLNYTRNGRYMVLGGIKGDLSVVDCLRNESVGQVHVNETVRDVTFLHNQTMFAAAQRKHIYIYDDKGMEIHRLRSHVQPSRIQFLPYHFLLSSVGKGGWLKYQDTSTGQLVAEHRTKLGACDTMALNPWNAVTLLGHTNGTVTMWSPTVNQPLVKMLCHKGPVTAITVDPTGHQLATAGVDGKVSIWDVRTFKKIHSYFSRRPAKSLAISETGLLAVTSGYQVHVWKDALTSKAKDPYMRHEIPGHEIVDVKFRPLEDVIGIGSTRGFTSAIVPGAGRANFDAFEANPFETLKQRQESEVHSLLEKLQPEMILLDPNSLGNVKTTEGDGEPDEDVVRSKGVSEVVRAAKEERESKGKIKGKQRGKNKYGKRIKRKHRNIVQEERARARQGNDVPAKGSNTNGSSGDVASNTGGGGGGSEADSGFDGALSRFGTKRTRT